MDIGYSCGYTIDIGKEKKMKEDVSIHNYYEEIEREGIEELFYAIMHRQWNEVERYITDNNCNWESIKDVKFRNTNVTIQNCFDFNMDFFKHPNNQIIYEKVCNKLGEEFEALECSYEFYTYDDKRFCKIDGIYKSVYDIFWDGNQPVLNLKYFQKQTLAAKQVMINNCSMVLDEVGTGKTVCGIYTIQQIIQERINAEREARADEGYDNLRILIICPYNKREDWHNDILRQLGLESQIINQADDGQALSGRSEKKARASIFVSGNVGGNGDDSNQQLKRSFLTGWDLVILDECHNCFDSYENVRAKRVLLLTATPIVPAANSFRDFSSYENRINSILGGSFWNRKVQKTIRPIELRLSDQNEIYTCYFKEDIFDNVIIKRDIRFIECARVKERDEWFNKLRYEKDFFSAIYSDQDDEILAQKMKNIFGDEYSVKDNEKLNTLKEIISGKVEEYSNDSFVVFCENTSTVDLLYEGLSVYASGKLMIGKLHSKVAEIKNVQANKSTIIQKLKRNIKEGNRSILITTGKSGGTGINLGEFTGVIHYELPFTSNELEQRFGRIERADSLIEVGSSGERKTICNKMIFLVNKKSNKPDFITNRMLYYSVNKIRITAKYIPIRNTILFHPEYMKRVITNGYDIFEKLLGIIDSQNIQDDLSKYLTYRNKKKDVIRILKNVGGLSQESTDMQIEYFLQNTSNQSEDDIAKIKEFKDDFLDGGNLLPYIRESFSVDEKVNILEWCDIMLSEIVEYYLFLKKTLILWNMWNNENADGVMSYFDDNDVEETSMTNEEEDNSFDKANAKESSKKQEEKIEKIILDILQKSLNEKNVIDYIIESLTKMKEKLNNTREVIESSSLQYSGLFFVNKEGSIENIKFE